MMCSYSPCRTRVLTSWSRYIRLPTRHGTLNSQASGCSLVWPQPTLVVEGWISPRKRGPQISRPGFTLTPEIGRIELDADLVSVTDGIDPSWGNVDYQAWLKIPSGQEQHACWLELRHSYVSQGGHCNGGTRKGSVRAGLLDSLEVH